MRVLPAVLAAAVILAAAAVCRAQEGISLHIFGSSACPECCELKDTLSSLFGAESIRFYEVMGNETNLKSLREASELAFPGEPPIYPLTGVFSGGRLVAVVRGNPGKSIWLDLSTRSGAPVAVGPGGEEMPIPPEAIPRLESLLRGGRETGVGRGPGGGNSTCRSVGWEVVAAILSAAAADSVNPCTFSVFTALTLLAAAAGGRRRASSSGAAFIAAVFLTYTALGFGLIGVFSYVPWVRYAVGALGLAVGAYEVASSLGGEFRSPLPGPLYRLTSGLVDRVSSSAGVPLAFLGGVVISLTLLPCSSGPYLVATSLLSGLPPGIRVSLLLAYNAIFVAPLAAILAAVLLLERWERGIKSWRSRRLWFLNVLAGALLIAVSVFALLG